VEPVVSQQALFESIVGVLDAGVVVEDADGGVIAANAAADRILGDGAVAIHEDGWPLAAEARPPAIALRTGRACTGVTLGLKRPGGEVRWVVANAQPLRDEEGAPPWGVVTSYTDVTDERHGRAVERRAGERFRSLIEYSSDVITILDEQGRQTYESPSVERVLGWAPGDFEGTSRLSQIHPDDSSRVVAAIESVAGRPGVSTSVEYRIRTRDGRWRTVESIATNRLHDPAVLGIVVNTRDVTEHRREQAALRATTSRLSNLVQNLKSGVLVEDEERRIALVNTDFCAIFGVDAPPNVLVGGDCVAAAERLKHLLADPDAFSPRIEELIGAGVPVTGEEVAFADGRTFERDYIPITEGGADRGHLWLYRDISERKAAEREAATARDEAIRASRLKSDFLATMSHEIRTPMNAVIGTVELLLDTSLSADQRELAAVVRDSAYGLLSLIDDALDLSKIEAEKLEPKEVEFELTAVVEGVADVLLSSARRKGLWLTSYVDPRAGARLAGDAQWLRQVLLNLLGNAVKFTELGEVHVRADLEAETRRSATIRFAVRDDGPGIPETSRDRLFEPFAQLEGSGRGGTGLGLAICQRLVGLMGGEIDLESRPGEGAEFSFTLTFPLAEHPAPAPPAAPPLRVLLVEACDAASRVVTDYLGAWGMTAERAADAAGARELAASAGPFDVAIVGTTLAEPAVELAESLPGDGTAYVLLKDVAHAAARDGQTPAPFATELNKPVKQARLFDAVVSAADPAALPRPAQHEPAEPPFRPRAGTRVLVAEDNEVNRALIVRQLAKLGVRADAVGSGREAIDAADGGGYDVVLMDCQMPGIDGLQAARAIRSLEPGGRRTTIVAVTAGVAAGEIDACLAAGMDGCLTKPFSTAQLGDALGRVLPPLPPTGEPAVDRLALERLRVDVGDDDALRRIAGLFVEGLAESRDQLRQASAAGDDDAVLRAAHRLRSSSATFGAHRLAALTRELEAVGSASAHALIADVDRESERVADAIAELGV
jgi:two-component system sensor histidine kinase/response regulator